MCIYYYNNRAKVHSSLVWNDGTLDFFEEATPAMKNNSKTRSAVRSVPVLKMRHYFKNSRWQPVSCIFFARYGGLMIKCVTLSNQGWMYRFKIYFRGKPGLAICHLQKILRLQSFLSSASLWQIPGTTGYFRLYRSPLHLLPFKWAGHENIQRGFEMGKFDIAYLKVKGPV